MFGLGSTEMIIIIIIFIILGLVFGGKKSPKKEGNGNNININVNESSSSTYAKLSELKELLDKGVLTQEEFEKEKKKILK